MNSLENEIINHRPTLVHFAYKYLSAKNKFWAEDMAQVAILKAINNLHTFKGDKGKLDVWLIQIVKNVCFDFNKKKVNGEVKYEAFESTDLLLHTDEPTAFSKEKKAMVRKYIAKLPLKYKSVILLKFFFDMTAKEIEKLTAISAGSVPMYVKRAKEQLASFDELRNVA